MQSKNLIIFAFALLLVSCNKKEQQLRERELELEQREQKVLAIEADYQLLLQLRDSIQAAKNPIADTITVKPWPASLLRAWSSKMICTESDCNNYVIGDQRNEVWKFYSDSTGQYMHVVNNVKLVRIFRATRASDNLELTHISDSTASKSKISILLTDIQNNIVKGTQTITGQKGCTAKFSVELTPSTKK